MTPEQFIQNMMSFSEMIDSVAKVDHNMSMLDFTNPSGFNNPNLNTQAEVPPSAVAEVSDSLKELMSKAPFGELTTRSYLDHVAPRGWTDYNPMDGAINRRITIGDTGPYNPFNQVKPPYVGAPPIATLPYIPPKESVFNSDEPRVTLTEGVKKDDGKAPVHLIDPAFILGVAEVLKFGANKYSERNWEKGINYSRVYSATMRHLLAFWSGEETDPETGISHLYHAACNLMFLQNYNNDSTKEKFDDRPK